MDKDQEIEVLLEVSARMSDPDTWGHGEYHFDGHHCILGHVDNVLCEMGLHNQRDYHSYPFRKIKSDLNLISFSLFNEGIIDVNDFCGRIAAKNVVDKRIRELKDGLTTS